MWWIQPPVFGGRPWDVRQCLVMHEAANMLVLSEGPSLVIQRQMGGWDQCQSIGQEKGFERDCDEVEVMV